MSKDLTPRESEFILYSTPHGDVKLAALVLDESVWLTQEGIQPPIQKSEINNK